VTPRRASAPIVALALALGAGGCGGGAPSLSARQLRTGASRTCTVTTQRLNLIPTPELPSEGAGFLRRGIAALAPEVAALAALHPEGEMGVHFRRAQTATEQELKALRSTLTGLKAGNDPIVAIKTLQAQLAPLEKQASGAWQALRIPACADT
jgi:hypothetical protein